MKTEDWLMFLKTDGSNMIVYNGSIYLAIHMALHDFFVSHLTQTHRLTLLKQLSLSLAFRYFRFHFKSVPLYPLSCSNNRHHYYTFKTPQNIQLICCSLAFDKFSWFVWNFHINIQKQISSQCFHSSAR